MRSPCPSLSLPLLLVACGAPELPAGSGAAVASLTSVPAGVACVRLTLAAKETVTRSHPVLAGAAATLDLGALPSGDLSVSGAAFEGACATVGPDSAPTWLAEPRAVRIVAGLTTEIALTFRPVTPTSARIDFAPTVVSIAAAASTTFAVLADGTVRAWGGNSFGQLGDGTSTSRSRPAPVPGLSSVRALTTGTTHACALLPGGDVKCWGLNFFGAIGDGTRTTRPAPTSVIMPLGKRFSQLSAGAAHTCALTTDFIPYCWGLNSRGQLGDGTFESRSVPTAVAGGLRLEEVRAGSDHSCGRGGSKVHCWGSDTFYKLAAYPGSGPIPDRPAPVEATWLRPSKALALGARHTCALSQDAFVLCTGDRAEGLLGDQPTAGLYDWVPLWPRFPAEPVALSAGSSYSCALLADGTVACFGRQGAGNGVGTTATLRQPTLVRGLTGVTAIAVGDGHACARREDGTVWCWGENGDGQLGDGTNFDRAVPVRVEL